MRTGKKNVKQLVQDGGETESLHSGSNGTTNTTVETTEDDGKLYKIPLTT